MLRAKTGSIAGWGNYPRVKGRCYRPESLPQLERLLSSDREASWLARGLGRSYGDGALTSGGHVLFERLDRILAFDPETGILRAEAGVSLATLLEVFVPRGFFPPVTPGTRFVTLGGALANDVHGKNHHRVGSFANFVTEILVLDANGQLRIERPDDEDSGFWATVGGLGLTGVILEVELRLKPIESSYFRVDTTRHRDLDSVMQTILETDQDYDYTVAWIDCLARGKSLGRSVLMGGNWAGIDELPDSVQKPLVLSSGHQIPIPFTLPNFTVNSFGVRAFNELYYRTHPARDYQLQHFEPYFYPLDILSRWNRMYGSRGFLQVQVTFPDSTVGVAMPAFLEALASQRMASFLAVLKRFGPQGPGWLSYPSEGFFLALDLPRSPGAIEYLKSLEPMILSHEGRVYLAKDAILSPEGYRAMYPQHARFAEHLEKVDPNAKFDSLLAQRLEVRRVG